MFPKIFGGAGDEAQPAPNNEVPSSIEQATTASTVTEAVPEDTVESSTKMSHAIEIYRRMTRKKGATRKEIVEVFMTKVGLTKSGAATYYQMIKKSRRPD